LRKQRYCVGWPGLMKLRTLWANETSLTVNHMLLKNLRFEILCLSMQSVAEVSDFFTFYELTCIMLTICTVRAVRSLNDSQFR
jgi:hypothetical protein